MITLILWTRLWTTMRVSAAVLRASSSVSRSSLCSTASTSFSPKSFFTNFTVLCTVKRGVWEGGLGLTWSLLLDLLGHQSKSGENFHQYLNDDFGHCPSRRESGINFKTVQEVFDRLEQINKSIVGRTDVLGCLIRSDVRRTCLRE